MAPAPPRKVKVAGAGRSPTPPSPTRGEGELDRAPGATFTVKHPVFSKRPLVAGLEAAAHCSLENRQLGRQDRL